MAQGNCHGLLARAVKSMPTPPTPNGWSVLSSSAASSIPPPTQSKDVDVAVELMRRYEDPKLFHTRAIRLVSD